jgi:hypothetical protein
MSSADRLLFPFSTVFSHLHLPRCGLALLLAVALGACGNANVLPPATVPAVVDTLALWAVTGTDIIHPSAFDLLNNQVVRTDRTAGFDFVFDIVVDSVGDTVPVLIPRGGVGLPQDGGLQRVGVQWDTLRLAPSDGYDPQLPVRLALGAVVVARSRIQTCNFGLSAGLYAKIQPLDIDLPNRRMVIRILVDQNCGYRGLEPGIPGS